jgi:hypothetical protein
MTLHGERIKHLINKEGLNKKGFYNKLNHTIETDHTFNIYQLVPDAYKICEFCKCVKVFEVENSNQVSDIKLDKYSELWFDLDSVGWWLFLCIIDRFDDRHYYDDEKFINRWYQNLSKEINN